MRRVFAHLTALVAVACATPAAANVASTPQVLADLTDGGAKIDAGQGTNTVTLP